VIIALVRFSGNYMILNDNIYFDYVNKKISNQNYLNYFFLKLLFESYLKIEFNILIIN